MRTLILASLFATGVVVGGAAKAHDLQVHGDHCGYTTDYDVQVTPDGIGFHRDSGKASDVFMHDGHLRVDGRDVTVSADDAARLRDYERQVRALLPEVAAVTREGINIGYAAIRTVMLTFVDNESDRRDMIDRLDRYREQALARVDGSLGKGEWKPHELDDVMEQGVQSTASDLAGKVAGSAVTAALSGDQRKVAALQARAESLDTSIDHEVNARSHELDKRVDALCPRLGSLDLLQQQFKFRLPDGSPLRLLSRNNPDNKKLVTATNSARADGGDPVR
ncbi:DUF2884 family protein [Dyella silvae]|uniref:DUF2884 family protein n=1 Tax=Dyella silvae TaxID=2994424 RepID=UPI00226493DC|nr:DUF2884 family protein [Dyella silvae]